MASLEFIRLTVHPPDTEFADHVTLDKRQTNLLNADQKNDLKYWVEEEKLALDVYNVFKAKWGKWAELDSLLVLDLELIHVHRSIRFHRRYTQVFGNIAKSESTHLTSVRKLLKTYGIPDPSARKAAGVFADPTLQSLYTQFVNKGSATIRAALEVGKEIEEMDLKDLARSKVLFANIPSVLVVLKNQIKSSENHKRAFERVLRVWG